MNNCVKCGREIPEDETFCPGCLEKMAKHPVASGTPVLLPLREHSAPKKVKEPSAEERQIASLKRRLKTMRGLFAASIILLAALAVYVIQGEVRGKPVIGQNYTAITSRIVSETTAETTSAGGN